MSSSKKNTKENATVNEPVFINCVREINSRHGYEVWEVDFVGIKTQLHYTTWIDPKFHNFKQWQTVLSTAQHKGVVINNLKLKDEDKRTVDADSVPSMEYVVPCEELTIILADYWNGQDQFVKLFGTNNEQ